MLRSTKISASVRRDARGRLHPQKLLRDRKEIGKLIRLGISQDTDYTYNCEAIENAVRLVFDGEIHVREEALPGRDNK